MLGNDRIQLLERQGCVGEAVDSCVQISRQCADHREYQVNDAALVECQNRRCGKPGVVGNIGVCVRTVPLLRAAAATVAALLVDNSRL